MQNLSVFRAALYSDPNIADAKLRIQILYVNARRQRRVRLSVLISLPCLVQWFYSTYSNSIEDRWGASIPCIVLFHFFFSFGRFSFFFSFLFYLFSKSPTSCSLSLFMMFDRWNYCHLSIFETTANIFTARFLQNEFMKLNNRSGIWNLSKVDQRKLACLTEGNKL